jgi:hypothetical protein
VTNAAEDVVTLAAAFNCSFRYGKRESLDVIRESAGRRALTGDGRCLTGYG